MAPIYHIHKSKSLENNRPINSTTQNYLCNFNDLLPPSTTTRLTSLCRTTVPVRYSWLALASTLNFLAGFCRLRILNKENKELNDDTFFCRVSCMRCTKSWLACFLLKSTHLYTAMWTPLLRSSFNFLTFFSFLCSVVSLRAAFASSWALEWGTWLEESR